MYGSMVCIAKTDFDFLDIAELKRWLSRCCIGNRQMLQTRVLSASRIQKQTKNVQKFLTLFGLWTFPLELLIFMKIWRISTIHIIWTNRLLSQEFTDIFFLSCFYFFSTIFLGKKVFYKSHLYFKVQKFFSTVSSFSYRSLFQPFFF